jgi:hypothetical protein
MADNKTQQQLDFEENIEEVLIFYAWPDLDSLKAYVLVALERVVQCIP